MDERSITVDKVTNPMVLDWLIKNQNTLDIKIDFNHGTQSKQYVALPQAIQAFIKDKPIIPRSLMDQECGFADDDMSSVIKSETKIASSRKRASNATVLSKSEKFSSKEEFVIDKSFRPPSFIEGKAVNDKHKTSSHTATTQQVKPLVNSSTLLQSPAASDLLWRRYQRDGYVYISGLIDRSTVMQARNHIVTSLQDMKHMDNTGKALTEKGFTGWTIDCSTGGIISGTNATTEDESIKEVRRWQKICSNPKISDLKKHEKVALVLSLLSQGKTNADKVRTEPYLFENALTWLRVKAPKGFTPVHADIFYQRRSEMYEGSQTHGRSCYFVDNYDEEICAVCKVVGSDAEPILRCDECFHFTHYKCLPKDHYTAGEKRSSGAVAQQAKPKKTAAQQAMVTKVKTEREEQEERRLKVLESLQKEMWYCNDCCPQHTLGTCWIPLGDVDVSEGVMCLMPQSRHLSKFYVPHPGAQLPKSFFSKAIDNAEWHTGSFQAGDVLFFDSHVVHCTSKNMGQSFRLSLDFRWDLVPLRKNVWSTVIGKYVRNTAVNVNVKQRIATTGSNSGSSSAKMINNSGISNSSYDGNNSNRSNNIKSGSGLSSISAAQKNKRPQLAPSHIASSSSSSSSNSDDDNNSNDDDSDKDQSAASGCEEEEQEHQESEVEEDEESSTGGRNRRRSSSESTCSSASSSYLYSPLPKARSYSTSSSAISHKKPRLG